MPQNIPTPPRESRIASFEVELKRCGGPAWIIEPFKARILAANAAGAQRYAQGRRRPPVQLDGAMPALMRLRELASEGAKTAGAHQERLVFWTAQGAESLTCELRRLAGAAGEVVFLVAVIPEGDASLGQSAARDSEDAPPRSDAETLQQIAQRIREACPWLTESERPSAGVAETLAGQDVASAMEKEEHDAPAQHLAKLAHELKTPLSAIVAAAEIMKDERFGSIGNDRYRGYAVDIHDSARHALGVINRMLGQKAPEVEKPVLEFAEVDLNAIVEGSVSAMLPLAERAGLALTSDLAPRLPHVVADPMSLKQILLNLLTNAIKFTGSGGSVEVATAYSLNGPVTLVVRDTGAGMSASEITRYLQADGGSPLFRREKGGLGLGLPLVRALSEANGARLDIDSTPGKGTTATVTFPKGRVIPV